MQLNIVQAYTSMVWGGQGLGRMDLSVFGCPAVPAQRNVALTACTAAIATTVVVEIRHMSCALYFGC